jgi:hypothetical protein
MNAKPGDVYGPDAARIMLSIGIPRGDDAPCSWPRHLRVGAVAVGLQPRRLDFHPD